MSRFLDALRSGRVLLMDGAMGTELQRAGLKDGECGDLWNLTHPESVRAVHQAYVDAGAEVLLTNTFQGHPEALQRHGTPRTSMQAYNRAALALARGASRSGQLVVGDIGPWSKTPFFEKYSVVRSLSQSDAILLETFSEWSALGDVYWNSAYLGRRMAFLLSLTYHRNEAGKLVTYSGDSPEHFAMFARGCKVAALGVNCGHDVGMDETIEIIRRYRSVTDLPLFARPNAGTPTRVGDQWVYPRTPEMMAERLPELLEAGVCMVGGCCGTTPPHIAAFRKIIDEWNARRDSHI